MTTGKKIWLSLIALSLNLATQYEQVRKEVNLLQINRCRNDCFKRPKKGRCKQFK